VISLVEGTGLSDVSSVLVVDDQLVFAELLAERLRRETAVGHTNVACTVDQARSAVGRRAPDVVLLAPGLEQGSGLDLIPHLEALDTRPRLVVLADDTVASSLAGVLPADCGLVSKESPFEDLLRVIDAVQRGEVRRSADVVVQMHPGDRPDLVEAPPDAALTGRQAEVLHCLLAGMTRAEIATHLRLSPHTVRDHVRHLFRILGATSTPDLLARARGGPVAEPRRLRVVPGP
jgi:DNA-binding NarL/FixJ family response regulator